MPPPMTCSGAPDGSVNPADRLREPPELLPDGGAPDYDKLAALCRALPLPGHPLRRRILALLAEGFEWHDPRP